MQPPTPPKPGFMPGDRLQTTTFNLNKSRRQQNSGSALCSPSRGCKMPQGQKAAPKDHWQSPVKRRGRSLNHEFLDQLEEIMLRLEHLNINEGSNEDIKDQKALVPFKTDGAIAPHDGFALMRRHRPRPKAEIDPETERVWKLLMGKEGSEGLEETDKEKAHWWEEERRIFHGRVDSFIARMHLVQGDRRFSKWKGSIVDSVIGVFLTQNVSDHLSSSAFMSLAAQFPLRSMRNRTSDRGGKSILLEGPDICTSDLSYIIKQQGKLDYPLYEQHCLHPSKSAENQQAFYTSWIEGTSIVEAHGNSLEEELSSKELSHDSFDSSVIQANGGVRSYSCSNSEEEQPPASCKPKSFHTSFTDLLQMEDSILFEDLYRSLFSDEGSQHGFQQPENKEDSLQSPVLRIPESLKGSSVYGRSTSNYNSQMQLPAIPSSNCWMQTTSQCDILATTGFNCYDEESISSQSPGASVFRQEKDASCMGKRVGQVAQNIHKNATQNCGLFPEIPMLDQHDLCKQSISEHSNFQIHYDNQHHERGDTLQSSSISVMEPPNPEELAVRQTHLSSRFVDPNVEEHMHSINKVNTNARQTTSKARKGNADGGKKDSADWDSLRKQAQAIGGRKERSKDTMDSLDYEALRCSSIHEISEAIKERGMNKMLAERIKEFLNRLVEEHGSLDLEWLRDVPPEKAKDYLLSIRGLGLKSVECVRLLTLHHLAFPVDTNVGRIAVRLGWVPLQPLPESLQLHLLELYPVLESIQKYLWPRLCKLDQRTL
uniref:Transcriptional activator DEMETER-like isoform X2 n=1 Tax=Rhizophora mucronata TaxID=61149 RepID=A0A2P2KM56_RHIMU